LATAITLASHKEYSLANTYRGASRIEKSVS